MDSTTACRGLNQRRVGPAPRRRAAQHAQWQQLDQRWHRLCGNDPDTVIATLAEAFEDNEAPSAPVGVVNDEVALVVLVPRPRHVVPEQAPLLSQVPTGVARDGNGRSGSANGYRR